MSDKYMKGYDLNSDDWVLVADGVRNYAIQFSSQGQIRVHVGPEAPGPDDVSLLVSKVAAEEPSTISQGQLPEDAQVWVRRQGGRRTSIVVVAY